MAKIKYKVLENKKVGNHSFYAVQVPHGTLSFDEVIREACQNTDITPSIMRAAVTEYMKAAQNNLLKGFRVPVGEEFLFLYPNLRASAKDELNQDGTVKKAATADMVVPSKQKTRLGCSVSSKYSDKFASEVSWQRVDPVTGSEVEGTEDVTDGGGDNTGGDNGGGGTPDPLEA